VKGKKVKGKIVKGLKVGRKCDDSLVVWFER